MTSPDTAPSASSPSQPGGSNPAGLDVLLVAYHSGAIIDRCLKALATFVPAGSRIILIDNSPDDPSAAEAVSRTPGAELLSEKRNLGFAAAVNDGLRQGTSELVLLVNPDIVSIDGPFESIAAIFARDRDVGAVAVRLVDEAGGIEYCRRRPRRLDFFESAIGLRRLLPRRLQGPENAMLEWDHSEERIVDNATGALLFLRRAAVEDIGGLDDRFFMYWEETDWLTRARSRGWRLLFTPAVSAVHAGRQGSEVPGSTHYLLFLESGYKYVRKHFGLGTELLLRASWIAIDSARLARSRGRPEHYRREVRLRLLLHLGLPRKV